MVPTSMPSVINVACRRWLTNYVFEHLGRPRPAEALAKAELARKIAELIAERRLTQAVAAALLDIDQPKVSALVRGRLAGFWSSGRSTAYTSTRALCRCRTYLGE